MTDRNSPIQIDKNEFIKIGHRLVDTLAEFFENIDKHPVTLGESPNQIKKILGSSSLPESGSDAARVLGDATDLLIKHSLFNGHPKFLGYITSSPAPLGALADLLASAINQNSGANILSPMATAVEKQTVQWLGEFIGLSPGFGGLLVSGGNMANLTAFLAARTAIAPKDLKENGLKNMEKEMVFYCSTSTHTWIEKAVVLFGHGKKSIRWIQADAHNRMNIDVLNKTIETDKAAGLLPVLVVGTAGDVSTGAVDDLSAIAAVCKKHHTWFHIDGAYGIPAAVHPKYKDLFKGLEEADSIALDPHKWLYAPLEAGCTLVKNPQTLIDTYSHHPAYYNFDHAEDGAPTNYNEYGFQNSRGFRALKVWMSLKHVGRSGYQKMIEDDIELAKLFFDEANKHEELQAISHNLSITTLRYVPKGISETDEGKLTYLNKLNEDLLNKLEAEGEMFLSNAVIDGRYCLRGCIVNFRTSKKDVLEMVEIVVKKGREVYRKLQDDSSV